MQRNDGVMDEVASPCISVCTLDENDLCLGCFRDLSEIANWGHMAVEEKRDVLARIAERQEQQQHGNQG